MRFPSAILISHHPAPGGQKVFPFCSVHSIIASFTAAIGIDCCFFKNAMQSMEKLFSEVKRQK
jgi:hypothetical protein